VIVGLLKLEDQLKKFANDQGVKVVGVAGPDRLDGPPSLDLSYTMPGAQSVIVLILPMNVPAIYDFLSKKSPASHNFDQFVNYQRMLQVEKNLANYLISLGYKAKAAPTSADYRPSLYVFSTQPALSLRLAAIASGIAGQSWSGNVMTKEYGAAIFLGAVVTDAFLASDPQLPINYFIEKFCLKCKRCVGSCPSHMFAADNMEYVLLNGELHSRGKRRNIDLCKISCFGLHSLSVDRKWSNWGIHWIDDWVREPPNPANRLKIFAAMLKRGLTTGDSTQRFDILRRLCCYLWDDKVFEGIPGLDEFPETEAARYAILSKLMGRVGIFGIEKYPIPMICGHCALVCAADQDETAKRYRMLIKSGIVVPGENGRMVNVSSFEEALELKRQFPTRSGVKKNLKDTVATLLLWHKQYFGFDFKTSIKAWKYQRQLDKAVKYLERQKEITD